MNVIVAVLERGKEELQAKLLDADNERRTAVDREADVAKKVDCVISVVFCFQ